MTSDLDFVRAAQAGEVAALGTLLETYRARLYATALIFLGDRAQAQDAVQETFLIALRRLQNLRDPAAARAWLHAIVRNECRMQLRKHRELPGVPEANVELHRNEVEEAFEQLVTKDWMWTALEELPEDLRVTVMLRYFTVRSTYSEIAAILIIWRFNSSISKCRRRPKPRMGV